VSYRRYPEKVGSLGWIWIVVLILLAVVIYRLVWW
jgi:hypothetical protein